MVLNLNINDITQSVIKERKKSSYMKHFVLNFLANYLEKFLAKNISKLSKTLDNSILKVEGTHKYLKDLSVESAENMLDNVKETIFKLENEYKVFEKNNFFDKPELKTKYKHLLKSVYKSEAIIHKVAYRNKEIIKIDDTIKKGIIKMNSEFLKKSV